MTYVQFRRAKLVGVDGISPLTWSLFLAMGIFWVAYGIHLGSACMVAGTVLVAVNGTTQNEGTDFVIDAATGVVVFQTGHIPSSGSAVTAGFEIDVPVRFDTDNLEISIHSFKHGAIPAIPVVEVRL